jgi:hypothetical protein
MFCPGFPKKAHPPVSKKLKSLFWQKIKNLDIPSTIWARVNQEFALTPSCRDAIDELFSIEKPSGTGDSNEAGKLKTGAGKVKVVALYDGKRTQNILIFLSRIQLSPIEIADMILRVSNMLLSY